MHILDNGICVTCRPGAARASEHEIVDGDCVTCKVTASRGFDPHQPRDPHNGKWITTGGVLGALIPDDANLFDTEKDWHRYDELYDVLDETAVSGFAAISMANGEAQVAFDDGNHRYVLADTDPAGMRDLADTIDRLVEEFDNADEGDLELSPNGLADWLTWGEDIQVGFDLAGDFRFTGKDAEGKEFSLPELSTEDAAKFADALREQADQADAQLED